MTAIRIIILCISAAVVCSVLRTQKPEMAMVVSLAASLTALLISGEAFGEVADGIRSFTAIAALEGENGAIVIKAAGISVISELGVQICTDAGESALGGRIRLGTRIVMLGMAMPLVLKIMDSVSALLGLA